MTGAGRVVGGKYELLELLGTGGMGAVWRAEHRALRQRVAVKLLDARGPSAERAVQRFLREGQIAAAVRHRNVVYISDFGTENGTPYLVMELLDGATLADCLFTGEPFGLRRFLELMIGCLDGLAAVHAAGIIHRDIKPENIFLVREGDGEFPKVLDFGLSRSVSGDDATGQITREGLILGTPEYISPEQARGSKTLDRRADLYSLGVLIYEALCGRIPFEAENSADLIAKVLRESYVPVAQHRPDVGPALDEFVTRAMARDREQRFASAEDMRAALLEAMERTAKLDTLLLPDTYGGEGGSAHYTSALSRPVPAHPSSRAPAPVAREDAATLSEGVPALPTHGPPRWVWAAVGAAAATLALVVGFSLASDADRAHGEPPRVEPAAAADATPARGDVEAPVAPAPQPPVPPPVVTPRRVVLTGLPEGAHVTLDGAPVQGPEIELPAGDQDHRLEVTAKGYRPWRVVHAGDRDGRYEVSLAKATRKPVRRSARKRPTRKPKAKSGLVRDLDF